MGILVNTKYRDMEMVETQMLRIPGHDSLDDWFAMRILWGEPYLYARREGLCSLMRDQTLEQSSLCLVSIHLLHGGEVLWIGHLDHCMKQKLTHVQHYLYHRHWNWGHSFASVIKELVMSHYLFIYFLLHLFTLVCIYMNCLVLIRHFNY